MNEKPTDGFSPAPGRLQIGQCPDPSISATWAELKKMSMLI
jgi:hypothetical protein